VSESRPTPVVVLIGTLDTKGDEYAFMRERLTAAGIDTLLVDAGTDEASHRHADVPAAEVAREAGEDLANLRATHDRGRAVSAMAAGAAHIVRRLHEQGRCDGVLAAGGSGGTTIGTGAMRALPLGVPKLMVSTVADLDTRTYMGSSDITMMASVVDLAGLNSVTRRILSNAAAAIAGMVLQPPGPANQPQSTTIAASMFGVTTPCVTAARRALEQLGYEVITFHTTGTGGRAMETLVDQGYFQGVLDVTTTELADEVAGGELSAGPDRLEAAGRRGIPQVVSLGALDMINFGPLETMPKSMQFRLLHRHNPSVTLIRTTAAESAEIGRRIGQKLSAARGPVAVYVPLRGFSQLSEPDGPFHDPNADHAMRDALRLNLSAAVEYYEVDLTINDPRFAAAMAAKLHSFLATDAGACSSDNGGMPPSGSGLTRRDREGE